MSIFSKLKSAKSPKDLASSIDAIDADILACEADIKKLEDGRERAIFDDGEAAIAQVQKELVARRNNLELLQIARRGAVSRLAEAEAAQRQRELEARHKEALKLSEEERRLLKTWHLAASALAELTGEIDAIQKAIATENSAMRSLGREDLVLPSLSKEVNAKRLEMWERHCASLEIRPQNAPVPVSLNIPQLFRIDHYWPAPQVDPGKEWFAAPLALLD
jgi:chromosome segregation ATPase